MLSLHTKAPSFTLADQDNKSRSLSDFLGSYVLVYFYPKDDTPGCTKEACMLTEVYDDFKTEGVVVIGISADSAESHKKFAEKYHLPFILLSDPEQLTIKEYGAKGMVFNKRISYLLDKEGMIVKTYENVDPATHAEEILKDVIEVKKINF